MNVLFLTMSNQMLKISANGIYTDLARRFYDEGHEVYVMMPFERRSGRKTVLFKEAGIHILGVQTLNVEKTNIIEKGLGQVMLEAQFKAALKKYLGHVRFDLILYSTPPITFAKVIEYAKRQNPQAVSYLMLKDIFPQNAVDLGLLKKNGLKGMLYRSFRKKEKKLYAISDVIGCMSPANVKFILAHNPEIKPEKVEICPNSCNLVASISLSEEQRVEIRKKYNLPIDCPIFIYGGNLGKPQGIPFLIECLRANKDRTDCHFLVVGNGTEYNKLEKFVNEEKPQSVSLFRRLPKEHYYYLTEACDGGLIFLDYRFTIPNYPSRLLSYLMSRKPILACTDPNCDTGSIAEKNGYGIWAPSNDVNTFTEKLNKMINSDIKQMGENGYQFYLNNYTVQHTYNIIMKYCI